jgi:hypothetical protein
MVGSATSIWSSSAPESWCWRMKATGPRGIARIVGERRAWSEVGDSVRERPAQETLNDAVRRGRPSTVASSMHL